MKPRKEYCGVWNSVVTQLGVASNRGDKLGCRYHTSPCSALMGIIGEGTYVKKIAH